MEEIIMKNVKTNKNIREKIINNYFGFGKQRILFHRETKEFISQRGLYITLKLISKIKNLFFEKKKSSS